MECIGRIVDHNIYDVFYIWASARDFGTYCIGEQRRLGRVCAYAQTGQSLSFSHAQSMGVDEGLGQNLDLYLRLIRDLIR